MTRRLRWWHAHVALAAVVVGVALLLILGSGAALIYGQHLDATGKRLYDRIAATHVEAGVKKGEYLPPSRSAAVTASNDRVAAGISSSPHPLATPQPVSQIHLVRNYSSRNGTRPILLVVHDTESPNVAGIQDLLAIVAWFNNVSSQASSNYTTDADGNTVTMVLDTNKAWTQAYFNPWAISDEMIGHASQTAWPDSQLRSVAQLFAAEAKRWQIPIQLGLVSGCTIVRPGIVDHKMLGACGGGHHDNGKHFPMARFIGLVKAYYVGGYKPKPVPARTPPAKLRAATGYWSWLDWRLGVLAWKGYGTTNPTVRPNVRPTVPHSWWVQLNAHVALIPAMGGRPRQPRAGLSAVTASRR